MLDCHRLSFPITSFCPPSLTSGGLWKLNRSLLEDQVLVGQYRERYREWQTLQDLYETRAQWWEMVKGPGTSDSSARPPVWRRLHRLAQREPSRPFKQTPGCHGWWLMGSCRSELLCSRGMSATSICPRPGCGAPESVRHLLWECSAAVDLWAKAGSLQFPHLPAREVLHGQLVLYGVSQQKIKKKDFAEMWLTLATIKDAIWTSRNLLVSRRRQMPPVAVIRMTAAKRKTSRAAGGAPRTQPPRRIACAYVDEGAGVMPRNAC
ncbi:uncharacterized protein LOC114142200, partial [Xiphophorus couchianus]|uniref:uncharacterized protein LOC114142200 n=1 Tax=Xiphophorus couchianus TaxID=32473 RepID=UPI0010161395